ncbi:hypothetical protein CORC01_09421 [Colletotrichum orchidophilum]|uniref:Uncharacterized protein n=1 Tax=Colletotrichum orchidophilum TaxID=1209926 RepID=A0A1G4B1P3_9PEZI|nr:uncharacterized protein CORC01_09421 [Colletotrichum orchidophilum]OHE95276.1 hypothetical protein CORC01_09421 [Colletotrichum orchidophilum]
MEMEGANPSAAKSSPCAITLLESSLQPGTTCPSSVVRLGLKRWSDGSAAQIMASHVVRYNAAGAVAAGEGHTPTDWIRGDGGEEGATPSTNYAVSRDDMGFDMEDRRRRDF